MSVILSNLEQVNSTTYVDLLGVLLGLERLPGELSPAFLNRIYQSLQGSRGHEYIGLLNEINLQLGLSLETSVSLTGDQASDVTVTLAGMHLHNEAEDLTIPLLTMDINDLWQWKLISDLVNSINQTTTFQAQLLGEDGLALQLIRQKNVLTVVDYPLEGQYFLLGQTGILLGTERFNVSVPSYTLGQDGKLRFSQPLPTGARMTYQYRVWPYQLVASPVGVLGLMEPDLAAIAVADNGRLAYQVREYVQDIMRTDRSYWGK